jgi:hypothetical protein
MEILTKDENDFIENFWLGVTHTKKEFKNVFKTKQFRENPAYSLVSYMAEPDNFAFTCKHLFNIELLPVQLVILKELWYRPFPMFIASRGFGKTFNLALYSLLRILFTPGAKVVITGAAFRQSKYVFEYMQAIYDSSPVLRDILSYNKNNGPKRDIDRCIFRAGPSKCTALPIGDGKRIRGERASHLIAEEFASINPEVYEQVISGFAAVSATPVLNVKNLGKIEALKALGKEHLIPLIKDRLKISTNQSVICGTPDFEFGHFCKYWKRYRKIILSKGDPKKLAEIMGDITDVGSLDYTDYSVIRLPWYLAPKGLMEEKTIIRAKSTMHKSLFDMEYNAIFIGDTEGFYRRTLLEKCIARIDNQIKKSNSLVNFTVSSKATKKAKYIMGVDPASERDNFSIVILELWPDHRRIVYCWTTTRARFKAQVKKGRTNEHDFYRHCARKILDLTKLFNIEYVGMDAQGGGIAIEEALGDPTILKDGEKAIYQIIDDDKEKYTDNLDGRHILVMCQFADASWVSDANHGMKKDFEERALLFPDNDSSIMGLLLEDDKANYKEDEDDDFYDFSDKLEDIALEVDDLLYELTTIQHSKTNAGRERWDTPEIKDDSVKKKGRLVKDRYSALLIANKVARDYVKSLTIPKHKDSSAVGGFAHQVAKTKKKDKNLYYGPSWFTDQVNKGGAYGKSVKKGY